MKLLICTQVVDVNHPILGFFHRWIEEFAKHCSEVHVICLQKGVYDLPPNVHVHSLGKEEGVGRITYVWRFFRYIVRYRKEYDSVFVHMNQIYVILGGVLWRLWGKRIGLWYAHGHVPLSLRFATVLAHSILTSTQSGFRIETQKKKVVGQGVDVARFTPTNNTPPERTSLCFVGRIAPVKDIQTLITAIGRIPDVTLDIIGGAETSEQKKYRAYLEQLVAEQGLAERVSFIGGVPNAELPRHMADSQLMVNTSHTGSLDKTMLEAMALGIPVLTCNESMREVLGDMQDTFMFPKGDVTALVQKIQQHKKSKAAYSPQLREIVMQEHTVAALIQKILRYV